MAKISQQTVYAQLRRLESEEEKLVPVVHHKRRKPGYGSISKPKPMPHEQLIEAVRKEKRQQLRVVLAAMSLIAERVGHQTMNPEEGAAAIRGAVNDLKEILCVD